LSGEDEVENSAARRLPPTFRQCEILSPASAFVVPIQRSLLEAGLGNNLFL
jgi:DNA topoisomerase VI subunit B